MSLRIDEPENWTEEQARAEARDSRDSATSALALAAAALNVLAFAFDRNPVWFAAAGLWIVVAVIWSRVDRDEVNR